MTRPDDIVREAQCPTCGQRVCLDEGEEGTGFYIGAEAAENERLVAERDRLAAALKEISETRLPTGNQVGRDELRGCHQARVRMQTIARAALAARGDAA